MRRKNRFIVFLIFGMILCLSLNLPAQQGRGIGRIHGTVQDVEGNPVEGVSIVAEHMEYGTTFESMSDKKGNWAIAGLGTGHFRITASKEGYGTVYHEMRVSQFSKSNPPVTFSIEKVQVASSGMPAIQDDTSIVVFEEGNQLFNQEKYSEAVPKFEEFLAKNPTIYQVNINIGNCYREMGEYEKAIEAYNKVLDKVMEEKGSYEGDDSSARALASIGETYVKQGDYSKANEYLKQAIDLLPNDETLAFNVGEIFFKQGETDKAIEYFKLSIQIKDNWGPPYRQLGYAYLNKGEYKLAVEALKKFLEVAPDDPLGETIRGLIPKLEELLKN